MEEFLALLAAQILVILAETVVRHLIQQRRIFLNLAPRERCRVVGDRTHRRRCPCFVATDEVR